MKIPRMLAFENGKCVAAGVSANRTFYPNAEFKVYDLPTDHYDFLGTINPVGKTEKELQEILA